MPHDFSVFQVGTETRFVPNQERQRRSLSMIISALPLTIIIGGIGYLFSKWSSFDLPSTPIVFETLWVYLLAGWMILVLLLFSSITFLLWRDRSVPLIIDAANGSVRHGDKLICEPGSVKAIRLKCDFKDVRHQLCEFGFVVNSGELKWIPSVWFSALSASDAKEISNEIAAILKVDVQPYESFFGVEVYRKR